MMTSRTTTASSRTPSASADAIGLIVASPGTTKPANTENMIAAAASTTGAACRNPVRIASIGGVPCACASWIRDTRKTW